MDQRGLKQILPTVLTFLVGMGITISLTFACWNIGVNKEAEFPKFVAESSAIALGFWLMIGTLLATGVSMDISEPEKKPYLELLTLGVTNGIGTVVFPVYHPTKDVTPALMALDWKWPRATIYTGIFFFSGLKVWLDAPWSHYYWKIAENPVQLIAVGVSVLVVYAIGIWLVLHLSDMPIGFLLILAAFCGIFSPVLGFLILGSMVLKLIF